MKKIITLWGLALFLTSCASTGSKMSRISPGMERKEAVHILGAPESTGGANGVEVIHYTENKGWWRYSYYFVRFVDGKVESYGLETRRDPVTPTNPPLKK